MKNKSVIIMAVMVCVLCCLNVVLFVGLIYNKDSNASLSGGCDCGSVENNVVNNITNNVVEYDTIKVESLETAVNVAIKKVEDAVVTVIAKEEVESNGSMFETESAYGSGVIYKREEIKKDDTIKGYKYYVITNRHVILDDNDKDCIMYIYFGEDETEVKANVLGYDDKVDIALLTFESNKYIQPAEWGDSEKTDKGDFVIAVGTPVDLTYYDTATLGIISDSLRYLPTDIDNDDVTDFYASYIQHDVAISPGNSGGGLFNLYGELIGINTLKINASAVEGLGFAIPSNVVRLIVEEYLEKGIKIVRPRFGITGLDVCDMTDYFFEVYPEYKKHPNIYTDKKYGIYITNISENTTIASTDIDIDDILLEVNGIKITQSYVINAMLNSLVDFQVGDEVTIKYYDRSSNEIKTISVILKA